VSIDADRMKPFCQVHRCLASSTAVIPAKAGIQYAQAAVVATVVPPRGLTEYCIPAFAGMTRWWGNASVHHTSPAR
jgi:hypothetical protein